MNMQISLQTAIMQMEIDSNTRKPDSDFCGIPVYLNKDLPSNCVILVEPNGTPHIIDIVPQKSHS